MTSPGAPSKKCRLHKCREVDQCLGRTLILFSHIVQHAQVWTHWTRRWTLALVYSWRIYDRHICLYFCMCECCPARALSLFANSQLETATCKNICVALFDFLYFLHFHFDFVFSLFLFLIAAVDAFQMSWFMATFRLCSDWLTAWMTDWLSSLTGCSPVWPTVAVHEWRLVDVVTASKTGQFGPSFQPSSSDMLNCFNYSAWARRVQLCTTVQLYICTILRSYICSSICSILRPKIYENLCRAQLRSQSPELDAASASAQLSCWSGPLAKRKVVGHATTYLNWPADSFVCIQQQQKKSNIWLPRDRATAKATRIETKWHTCCCPQWVPPHWPRLQVVMLAVVQSARATLINSAQTHTSIWIMKRGPRPPTWKWTWTWTWTWTLILSQPMAEGATRQRLQLVEVAWQRGRLLGASICQRRRVCCMRVRTVWVRWVLCHWRRPGKRRSQQQQKQQQQKQ